MESEYKAGSATGGFSVGVTGADIYTVTVSESTSYEGVVGDVLDGADYSDWFYSFGLVAYNRGILSNAGNEPLGCEPDCIPYQVLTYWTKPMGSGY